MIYSIILLLLILLFSVLFFFVLHLNLYIYHIIPFEFVNTL
jgi:hypothetical protein